MVIDGNVEFKIKNKKTDMGNGDIILIPAGEKYQINSEQGAKVLQLTQISLESDKNTMNIQKLTSKRHSTRTFLDKPVSKKDIYYILKIGIEAPSGVNRQPWKFIVVSDPEIKRKIREQAEKVEKKYYDNLKNGGLLKDLKNMGLSWKKPFLETAPFLICIFSDPSQPFYKESLWISAGWMLLAAVELGLGTLTYKPENMDFIRKILNVPEEFKPELIMPIGYAPESEGDKRRKDMIEVVSWV
jgi:nitroreductase